MIGSDMYLNFDIVIYFPSNFQRPLKAVYSRSNLNPSQMRCALWENEPVFHIMPILKVVAPSSDSNSLR